MSGNVVSVVSQRMSHVLYGLNSQSVSQSDKQTNKQTCFHHNCTNTTENQINCHKIMSTSIFKIRNLETDKKCAYSLMLPNFFYSEFFSRSLNGCLFLLARSNKTKIHY